MPGNLFFYLSATRYASMGLVALLLYLYPAFVILLTLIIFKTRLTWVRLWVLILATVGAAFTANPEGGQLPGILLAVAAAVIYAVYLITGASVLKKVSSVQSSAVIFASTAMVFGSLAALNGPHWPSTPAAWQAVAAISLVATILPVVAFLAGIQRIGPTDASLLSTVEPVVTVLLAMLLFGEVPQPRMLFGGVLILTAVLLLTTDRIPMQEHL